MLRLISFFLLISISLFADKKVEVFASSVDINGSVMKADGDVVVLYDGMYASADTVTYDKQSGILELYGNVQVLQGARYYAMGDYMMLNIQEDSRHITPFFFQEYRDELWSSAKSAKSKEQVYELYTGVISSCNPQNPDWTIRFSSGSYDDNEQWMQMYNARLYAGNVPILYLPYFAYPTDRERRSGLLRPIFGFSGDEGFMYKQPIYLASDPQWDLEILPQVRSNRGKGIYTVLRFVDSAESRGSFTVGSFQENISYQDRFNLKNEKHYGFEFDYENKGFLDSWFKLNSQSSSGIFADVTYLNDIEYLNLKKMDTLEYSADSQVTSRVNLFVNNSEEYFGIYGKYFIDLNKNTNSDTLQYLPIIQYHKYLNTFFNDHFMYSIDYRGTNFYRETRKNAIQNEVTIPLELQFSLFDEYLTLIMGEHLYGSYISFYGSNNPTDPNNPSNTNVLDPIHGYSPGGYVREFQTLELNANLVKEYDDFSHSISFSIGYMLSGKDKRSGFYDDYKQEFKDIRTSNGTCEVGPCEYDALTDILEQASLEFTQFVFLKDGNEKLYHRLKQLFIYESGYEERGDLENELRYNFTPNLYYYNNAFYNYDRNVISKAQNTIGYNSEEFIFKLSHLYEDKLVENITTNVQTRTKTSYLTTNARYNYSRKWQYFAGYAYDIELSETKNRHIGFLYDKRCWSLELKYLENIRPTLITTNGVTESASIKDRIIYLTINLRPLGGIEVDYKSSTKR